MLYQLSYPGELRVGLAAANSNIDVIRAKTPEPPRLCSAGNSGKYAPVDSEKWAAKLSADLGVSKEFPGGLSFNHGGTEDTEEGKGEG